MIATIVLQSGVTPRPVLVKCRLPNQDSRLYKLHIGPGSGYAMNGLMQLNYVHIIQNLTSQPTEQRIVIVFRYGT